MAMSAGRISGSKLGALLMLVMLFASTGHALVITNKRSSPLTVFAPPICKPCYCPMIYCITTPCNQNCPCPQKQCQPGVECNEPCFCTLQCIYVPGVIVEVGVSVTLSVDKFPLTFLTVELNGVAYIVKAVDLKLIGKSSIVAVISGSCGNGGIPALVDRKHAICLVPGERYGS